MVNLETRKVADVTFVEMLIVFAILILMTLSLVLCAICLNEFYVFFFKIVFVITHSSFICWMVLPISLCIHIRSLAIHSTLFIKSFIILLLCEDAVLDKIGADVAMKVVVLTCAAALIVFISICWATPSSKWWVFSTAKTVLSFYRYFLYLIISRRLRELSLRP